MKNCDTCGGCSNCGGCSGCGNSLSLTPGELELLQTFSQCPFMPVARKTDSETPIYLESGSEAENALILACLEKKDLIDIDYHMPLRGFDYSAYGSRTLHGSMALTLRGQQVLELLDLQGIDEA